MAFEEFPIPTRAAAVDIAGIEAAVAKVPAALVSGNVYSSTAAGLAATLDGQQFQVVSGDEIVRYRRTDGTTAVEVARYPSAAGNRGGFNGAAISRRARDEKLRRIRDRTLTLRAQAQARLLRSGKTIHVSTTATGAGNGTSWANAYTSLSAAVLTELADGDRLLVNAPASAPLALTNWSLATGRVIRGVEVCGTEGPDGVTVIDGRLTGAWTDAGGGVWSRAMAAAPNCVAYDLRQDDATGTLTGVDVTLPRYQIAMQQARRAQTDCRAWVGFLRRSPSATTTPAEGFFSYTGGVCYINPPGSPVSADVDSKTVWFVSGHGWSIGGGGGAFIDGWLIDGITTFFTPSDTAGQGYGILISIGQNCTIDRHRAILSGYHANGFVGRCRGNRIIESDSFTLAVSQESASMNPFVFYTGGSETRADCIGHGLLFAALPLFDGEGKGIFPAPAPFQNTMSPRLGYSHSPGGGNLMQGIEWSGWWQMDWAAQMRAKHPAHPMIVGGSPVNAADFTRGTVDDAWDWPIVARDGYAVGETAEASPWVDWYDCDFDRTGQGQPGSDALVLSNLMPGAPFSIRATGGSIKTGLCREYYGVLQTGSRVRLRGVDVELQLGDLAGNQLASDVTVDLEGCTVRSWSNNNTLIGTSDTTYNAGVASAPLILRGGNVIDEQLIGQKSGTWPTTADRSVAEVWAAKDPIFRDVIGVRLTNYGLGANLVTNGNFAADLSGWTTPDGGWAWSSGAAALALVNAERRLQSSSITGLVAGDIVQVEFTLGTDFLGSFQCRLLTAANALVANRPVIQGKVFAAGTYRKQIVWQADYDKLEFVRMNAGNTRYTLDNVSVRKLTALS